MPVDSLKEDVLAGVELLIQTAPAPLSELFDHSVVPGVQHTGGFIYMPSVLIVFLI